MRRISHYALIAITAVLATSIVVSPISYAYDKKFFADNGIIIYNPDGDVCGVGAVTAPITPEQKIGQLMNVGFDDSTIGNLKTAAVKYQFGGVYLNIKDPSKLSAADITALNANMKSQLIVATDDEGGKVYRLLPKGDQPSAKELGAMTDSQVLAAGKDTGIKLKKLGVNVVLGPVLDLDTGLKNAISPYDRSFSSDPNVVLMKAAAWASGVTSEGVGVVFKHFPGIGSNVGNTDETYVTMTSKPNLNQYADDVRPFSSPNINNSKSGAIMLANFVLPEWGTDPVSINDKAVYYLRNSVGFKGLVTTDDLSVMGRSTYGTHQVPIDQAVVKALNAKVDMPLFNYPGDAEMDKVIASVKKDVDESVINFAYQKVTSYKTSLGLSTNPAPVANGPVSTGAAGNAEGTPVAESPVVTGDDNRAKIWNFLISTPFEGYGNKPFGAAQAAGAVGNFYQESGWRFNAVESNGEGHGIAQWSYDRKSTLFALAGKMGKPWSDPAVQFQMIKNELKSSYGSRLLKEGYDKLTDPLEASFMFQKIYEGAGKPMQANRDKAAKEAFDALSGAQPSAAFSADCTEVGGATQTASDLNNTQATFVTKDGFPVYMQTDDRWKNKPYGSSTIGPSGCGPSALAMVITALTGVAVTPLETATKAGADGMYIAGTGSSWDVAKNLAGHYNLKATKISQSVTAINAALKSGSYVVTSGAGSLPFSRGGHYIAIRGIAPDGKWLVADSAHKISNDMTFTPSTLLSMTRGGSIYAISK